MIKTVLNAFIIVLVTLIGLLIVVALAAKLFGIDLKPTENTLSELMSNGRLVNFDTVYDSGNATNLRVCKVERKDTDGDGFREWLVYYQFDTVGPSKFGKPCPDNSPRSVSIYDSDRGNPPIVFPYNLKAPDRDFLGENGVILEQHEIVKNIVAPPPASGTVDEIPELFFFGVRGGTRNQLTIFKYQYNTDNWESPTNIPDRYVLIGAFNGSGGISFDEDTYNVTVKDRGPFERSQLVVKTVYELHGESGAETYMQSFGASSLRSPIESTIDFAGKPPADIFETEYPEKIVLAFYQSLDPGYERGWSSDDFLADGSQAAEHFGKDDLPYFGFANRNAVSDLAVVALQYFPLVEQVSASATVEGPRPQYGYVEVAIAARQGDVVVTPQILRFLVSNQNGQWKIDSRWADIGEAAPPPAVVQPTPTAPGPNAPVLPTAKINVFLRGKNGLTFGFDGGQSTAPGGKIVAYEWNFGDGSTGSGDKIIYTYAQAGTHTVTLTVYDDKGQQGTTAVNVP